MITSNSQIDVWRVCELDSTGALLTLYFPWQGGRRLPKNSWLKSESFRFEVGGRASTLAGFHCYLNPEAATEMMARRQDGRQYAMVYCQGIGVFPSPADPESYMADQIKLVLVEATQSSLP
jgi:hypothetical protein